VTQIAGKIRKALPSDIRSVLQLLEVNGLPTEGVHQHFHQFLVWESIPGNSAESRIGGCVGLELYGHNALLRSLSIDPQYQSKGVGTQLLNLISTLASARDVERLFLLTTTADSYFDRHHFTRISRDYVPMSVKESIEFQSACPSTAVCMVRNMCP
jgi:amino-acid N-acetyltransferase